ncbi:MAG TPA: hypothetical protein VGF81_06100 [Solirubrobacteraceae bacterium]|jgi:hypothetical protein
MPRARASVPPDAIRIEDEVWQEAFRETIRPRSRARLRSHEAERVAARPARSRPGFAANTASTVEPEAAAARTDERAVFDADAPPARRTVTITGRGAERNLWATGAGRRRPPRRPHERAGFKPDRVAMWAVFLGMLLLFVAAASAHV